MAYQPKVAPRSYSSGYVEYRLSLCNSADDRAAMAAHLLAIMSEQLRWQNRRKKNTDDTLYAIGILNAMIDNTQHKK